MLYIDRMTAARTFLNIVDNSLSMHAYAYDTWLPIVCIKYNWFNKKKKKKLTGFRKLS